MNGFALLPQADQPGGAAPRGEKCHGILSPSPRSISGKMKD
ncbi:MAG: hypothetical protein HLUCCO07_09770 [Rhodobacteraceae bacterium HLUCCO07]|nr:MAG: hypothetical protein HLUCCO07_09770 [Rhodobacteraceae bacterium HLUCCO07]